MVFILSCWNTHHLEGDAYVALKPLYTFQHSECLPNHASCPYHMHLCTTIPSEMLLLNWKLVTRWKVSLLFSPEDTVSMISNKNIKFVIAGSNPVNLKQVCRFQMHRVYSHLDVALVVMCMQVQFELWHDKESYCYFCKHNISPMKARTSINYTPSLERSWREQVLIVSERALCAHNTPYYIPLPNDPRNTQPYFWENRPQLHVTPQRCSSRKF